MDIFLNVVKNNYANFKGRATRKEFWMYMLVYCTLVFGVIILATISSLVLPALGSILSIVYIVIAIGLLVPTLAVGVRRMHDVEKNGWYIFIPIYSIILAVQEGDNGVNLYGEDPKYS